MIEKFIAICLLLIPLSCSAFEGEAVQKTESVSLLFTPLFSSDLTVLLPARFQQPQLSPHRSLPRRYAGMILELAKKHEISWQLIAALIRAESNFNSKATSHRGARGLMQITSRTASRYRVSAKELYEPYKNVETGIRHLKMLLQRYAGNLELALAAYNTGEFAVDRYKGMPPFPQTRAFVKKILRDYLSL